MAVPSQTVVKHPNRDPIFQFALALVVCQCDADKVLNTCCMSEQKSGTEPGHSISSDGQGLL